MEGLILFLLAGCVFLGIFLYLSLETSKPKDVAKITELNIELKKLADHNATLTKALNDSEDKFLKELENNRVILSQKKSSETKMGQMTEHLVPFLDAFPYDPKQAHFLGQPIDFIVFDYDDGKIVFVEVKTGNARESPRQKLIKNIIKSGRVYYESIRINPKGVKVKETKNNE